MLGAASRGLCVGTQPKGLGLYEGPKPRQERPRQDGAENAGHCSKPANGSSSRFCGVWPSGSWPVQQTDQLTCESSVLWPLPPAPAVASGLAPILYLTNQALDSMTDLPAGSPPHMLHVTEAEATVPTRCGSPWEPWPPTFAWTRVSAAGDSSDSWAVLKSSGDGRREDCP